MQKDRLPNNKDLKHKQGKDKNIIKCYGEHRIFTCKRMTSDILHTKVNSTWVKDLYVSPQTIKLLKSTLHSTPDTYNKN